MTTPAQTLGRFAAELKYESIPSEVAERAKDCIIDTVGVCTFGSRLPWSRMVAAYAQRYRDDPKSFSESALQDLAIRATARAIELRVAEKPGRSGRSSRVKLKLRDGRELARDGDFFKGMPADPLSRPELRRKFMLLTADMGESASAKLFERLERMETQKIFSLA